MHLAHAVDRLGSLDAKVGRRLASGRLRPKGANGTWDKEAQLVAHCHLEDIVQAANVDLNRPRHILLAHRAEQGAEVNDPVDAILHYDSLQTGRVQDVDVGEVTAAATSVGSGRWLDNVRHDDVVVAVASSVCV